MPEAREVKDVDADVGRRLMQSSNSFAFYPPVAPDPLPVSRLITMTPMTAIRGDSSSEGAGGDGEGDGKDNDDTYASMEHKHVMTT